MAGREPGPTSMTRPDAASLRYTQSVEIDEKKLCEMKDRLLQKEIAMTRLNSSSENILNEYLNSVIDGQVLLELSLHGEGVDLQAN